MHSIAHPLLQIPILRLIFADDDGPTFTMNVFRRTVARMKNIPKRSLYIAAGGTTAVSGVACSTAYANVPSFRKKVDYELFFSARVSPRFGTRNTYRTRLTKTEVNGQFWPLSERTPL